MFNIIFCRLLDLNRGPLESEATALPTELPLPLFHSMLLNSPKLDTKIFEMWSGMRQIPSMEYLIRIIRLMQCL